MHSDIRVNNLAIEFLREFEDHISVNCDKYPEELVEFYNTINKSLVSKKFVAEGIENHVKINKDNVNKFLFDSKDRLTTFRQIIDDKIKTISAYADDKLNIGANDFMKLISEVRKLTDYQKDFEEEKKVNYDWLFI